MRIKLDVGFWRETPHTHCIIAVHTKQSVAVPMLFLRQKFDPSTANAYARAIRRFDQGTDGPKSRSLIEDLAKKLGYEGIDWT